MPIVVKRYVKCDVCPKELAVEDAINFIGVIGSPGHASLAPFQQEHEEGWACCIEHWRVMAHNDVEHLAGLLEQKHKEIKENG